MKSYNVQYSIPGKNPAVSEWNEKTKVIQANSDQEAIKNLSITETEPG